LNLKATEILEAKYFWISLKKYLAFFINTNDLSKPHIFANSGNVVRLASLFGDIFNFE
jgi:hypothetical protein